MRPVAVVTSDPEQTDTGVTDFCHSGNWVYRHLKPLGARGKIDKSHLVEKTIILEAP